MRKAKIVCTIGPASRSLDTLEQLLDRGMDVARLNFSHGTLDEHAMTIALIRQAAGRRGRAIAVLQDLQGPRIRLGALPDGGIHLQPDQRVRLVGSALRSGGQHGYQTGRTVPEIQVPVTYPNLSRDVKPSARILIDDGLIELRVLTIESSDVLCTVVTPGLVLSSKGMNLPGTAVSAPTLTDRDREHIRFGVQQGVDYLALSFVRGPADIGEARKLLKDCGGDQPIIAKIERAEAVEKLDAILEEADGVMIARGDLGVEMGPEVVPVLQKRIISQANRRRRLVITATQMLESMTRSPRPTRAEASDVANAVFDGTDALMLSAETAIGQYSVEAVQVMDRIVQAAEVETGPKFVRRAQPDQGRMSFPEAISTSASTAAAAIGAGAIVVFSEKGMTARLMSKQRPVAPIIAFTPFESVRQRMALYWGVLPHTMAQIAQTDERITEAERRLKAEGLAKAGQRIVILSGTRIGWPGGTNLMKLHEVD
jgi:pyruvate kinase